MGRKIAKKCLQTSCFFGILSCQNAANTSVFRRFALRAGSIIKVKKTLVFTIHFKRLVTKTSQKTVFSKGSSKTTVNSGVLD